MRIYVKQCDHNQAPFPKILYASESIILFKIFCCRLLEPTSWKSLLQFIKRFPISQEEWPHWQQCSTDLSISSPLPMCKCFDIKEHNFTLHLLCGRWVSSPFHLPFIRLQVFGDQWLVRMSRYESEHASVCLSEKASLWICASTGASHRLCHESSSRFKGCDYLYLVSLVERLESDVNAGWLCSISSSDLCVKATLETF